MTIVGGLRSRLIYDSIRIEIERALGQIGWFDAGRQHLPINFVALPIDDSQEIPLSTLVLVGGNAVDPEPLELGTDYAEHKRVYYLDFYAENQSVGEHLIFDCKGILEGRMPSISRGSPTIQIYDYTQATPPVMATVEIDNVEVDKGHVFNYPYQKYWYSCMFEVTDVYGNENG